MKFSGSIVKSGKLWAVEIPLIDGHTQGRTRKEALFMAEDLVKSLLEDDDFVITGRYTSKLSFCLEAEQGERVVALALRKQRQHQGLSAKEVARRMGQTSPNAYYRFESGKSTPTLAMLDRLMRAVGATQHLGLSL